MAFPTYLLEYDLTWLARIIYMLFLSRTTLSLQHDEFIDEHGKAFVVYEVEDLADILNKKERTIKYAISELKKAGLIERCPQETFRQFKTYVKIPTNAEVTKKCISEVQKDAREKCKKMPLKNNNNSILTIFKA